MKICSNKKCSFGDTLQLLENFHKDKTTKDGHCCLCKFCVKEYMKWYRENNKEKLKLSKKRYYQDNRELECLRSRTYNAEHTEEKAKKGQQYYQNNRETIIKKQYLYKKKKLKENINFRLAENLRSRARSAIKNGSKSGSVVADLMISIVDFKVYLEERFYPNPDTGEVMSWENYGRPNGKLGWDIDHIIPLSAFDLTDREQFLKAAHFSNLRPMWAKQNNKEKDRGMSLNRKNTVY